MALTSLGDMWDSGKLWAGSVPALLSPGTCLAVPPQPLRSRPKQRRRNVGGVRISILLWIEKELLKSVSFEVNLSG